MDKKAHSSPLAQYGWFNVAAGLALLALAAVQRLSGADNGIFVSILAGTGAFVLLLAGWLLLSIAAKNRSGRWPHWGMLNIWPAVGAMLVFAAISAALGAVVYYLGGAMERLLLAGIPQDVGARGILSLSGYLMGCLWLACNLPGIGLTLACTARAYMEMMQKSEMAGDVSPT